MTENQSVAVTEADQGFASRFISASDGDHAELSQLFAEARLAAQPGWAWQGVESALAFIDKYFEPWGSWKTPWWEGEVSDGAAYSDSNALKHVANLLRRATPPTEPTPQDSGEVEVYAWAYSDPETGAEYLVKRRDDAAFLYLPVKRLYADPTPASPERGGEVERLRGALKDAEEDISCHGGAGFDPLLKMIRAALTHSTAGEGM